MYTGYMLPIIFHFKKATDCTNPPVHTSCSSRLCLRAARCLITPHSLYVGGCAVVAPKGQLPPRLYFWVLHREASQTLISPACQLLWSSILRPSMLQCSTIVALGRATAHHRFVQVTWHCPRILQWKNGMHVSFHSLFLRVGER